MRPILRVGRGGGWGGGGRAGGEGGERGGGYALGRDPPALAILLLLLRCRLGLLCVYIFYRTCYHCYISFAPLCYVMLCHAYNMHALYPR